jgi:hypothetical protein
MIQILLDSIYFQIFLFTWFFTKADFIQQFIDTSFQMLKSEYIAIQLILDKIYIVLGCWKCLTLWTMLYITHDIWMSLMCSFITWMIDKIIEQE